MARIDGLKPFKKGEGGRPKGVLNKTTLIRETFVEVFRQLQTDPKHARANLLNFAKSDPKTFYQIVGRLLPVEITGTITSDITMKVEKTYEVSKSTEIQNDAIQDIPHEVIPETDGGDGRPSGSADE